MVSYYITTRRHNPEVDFTAVKHSNLASGRKMFSEVELLAFQLIILWECLQGGIGDR
jgi:hypothetical protein